MSLTSFSIIVAVAVINCISVAEPGCATMTPERLREFSVQESTLVNNIAVALKTRYDVAWERVSGDVSYPDRRLNLIKLPVRSIDSSSVDVNKQNAFAISSKFLRDNAELLGIAQFEFAESRVFEHQVKEKVHSKEVICHMDVRYKGVEIYGAGITADFADSFLVRISFPVETKNMPKLEPTIDRDRAFQIASNIATKRKEDLKPTIGRQDNTFGNPARSAEDMSLDKERLLIYSTRVFGGGPMRLMWELTIRASVQESLGAAGTYFIDAHSGEFLWRSSGRTDCW